LLQRSNATSFVALTGTDYSFSNTTLHAQSRRWLHSHGRHHAEALASNALVDKASATPDAPWPAPPPPLRVVSDGMVTCRTAWAADSTEIKAQNECAPAPLLLPVPLRASCWASNVRLALHRNCLPSTRLI
jgi:hypothetical protein